MSTSPIKIAELLGTDLSSRAKAAVLRREIVRTCESGVVTIDFQGVRTVSESFADEIFGVLVEAHGPEWIRKNVSAINLNPDVRDTILEAVLHRIEPHEPASA